ncbi:glyoxalase-like protein [Acidovorax delafieldii]|uniref:Glyoxalase-like protein n=1 Tax=Acidovorax delafieldii TaxID=47920 RepID=A0A561XCF1_ACIDE|nr:VOC family protein [Acidovorax delafieldii]TWG33777.1 glyoxalase-like protein [Acidovorax delafieldii]
MTATSTQQPACVDHLVVLAADLASGVAWCERTLGITPTAGGEHPLMGTHNRIFNVSSPAHPRAYLEIIAINPGASKAISTSARRWFDMDDANLQGQVAQHGPQLIHWVASVPDVEAACTALSALDMDRGAVITASRPTPHGLLQWQITVRDDGLRLMDGCLPTLIQWGAAHPCDSLPASGVQLEQLALQHPQAATLQAACTAVGVAASVLVTPGTAPRLSALLGTPRGPVTLTSVTSQE